MVERLAICIFLACWVGHACAEEQYQYHRREFEADPGRINEFIEWIKVRGLVDNVLAKNAQPSQEVSIGAESLSDGTSQPGAGRRIEIRFGKTFFNFDYDSRALTLLHYLQHLPPSLPSDDVDRIMKEPNRRASYCRVSLDQGRATAVDLMRKVLGDDEAAKFHICREGLMRHGSALHYKYYYAPVQDDRFFDGRALEVTVNPNTGEVIVYQLLGKHVTADYEASISRAQALERFWQRYRGYESRLKLNRMGLVKLQYFGRPQTWYWQICMDYKVRDVEAYQQAFPWAGDTARLTAWIDAETGDIFGAREPDW